MNQGFDTIGRGYSLSRSADPRISRQVVEALDDVVTVVSVGPTTGSYEPRQLALSAVEPSIEMIRQRAARCSFDALMALPFDRLIVGHGQPLASGAREALAPA
jgi:hypothetical protein